MLRTVIASCTVAIAFVWSSTVGAADPNGALTVVEAGPDFALQGEYTGTIDEDGKEIKLGIQVIALGGGKFRAVAHAGGLPGDGWNGEKKVEAEATAKEGEIVFANPAGEGIVKDGKFEIRIGGEVVGTLEKVVRKSPTLGAKPPEGAVVLYGGPDDAEKWEGGKADENGLLQQGAKSKETFAGPLTLHLEFQLSFKPAARGQGRANSGCYVQGRHEVQILDSFGLAGKNNEAGGIYEVSDPSVNMCFPPLSWQTYDIDFTPATFEDGKKTANARMTVRHNGVVVQDDVEVPKATRAAPVKEGPGPGPIYLQNHGNQIRFRNVWVQLGERGA